MELMGKNILSCFSGTAVHQQSLFNKEMYPFSPWKKKTPLTHYNLVHGRLTSFHAQLTSTWSEVILQVTLLQNKKVHSVISLI